jgi:phage tail-like protein
MPSSSSPCSSHSLVLFLENCEGDGQPLGSFEDVSELPEGQPGRHKADVTLRRGVCKANELWNWILAERGLAGERWRSAVLRQRNATGAPLMSWRLEGARPKKYTGATLEGSCGEVSVEELVLSVEYIQVDPRR